MGARKENVGAEVQGRLGWFEGEDEELLRVDFCMESKFFQNYSVITSINRGVVGSSVGVFRYEELEF